MTRPAQNLLMITLGLTLVWITLVNDEYANYVKPALAVPLLATAAILIVLGAAGLRRHDEGEVPSPATGDHEHGHDHGQVPRVAWMLCLPVLAVFVIAPPALGTFTADRAAARPAPPPPPSDSTGFGPLDTSRGPVKMPLGEFMGRAYDAQSRTNTHLVGVPVKLTGFVVARKSGDGWYLTRLKMACCAGDAIPFQVLIHGLPRPKTGAWVQVVGTWRERYEEQTVAQALDGREVTPTAKPEHVYE